MQNLRIRLCTFGSVMFSIWKTQCLSRHVLKNTWLLMRLTTARMWESKYLCPSPPGSPSKMPWYWSGRKSALISTNFTFFIMVLNMPSGSEFWGLLGDLCPNVLWHTRFTKCSPCIYVKLLSLWRVFLSFSYENLKNSTLHFWLGNVFPMENSMFITTCAKKHVTF